MSLLLTFFFMWFLGSEHGSPHLQGKHYMNGIVSPGPGSGSVAKFDLTLTTSMRFGSTASPSYPCFTSYLRRIFNPAEVAFPYLWDGDSDASLVGCGRN